MGLLMHSLIGLKIFWMVYLLQKYSIIVNFTSRGPSHQDTDRNMFQPRSKEYILYILFASSMSWKQYQLTASFHTIALTCVNDGILEQFEHWWLSSTEFLFFSVPWLKRGCLAQFLLVCGWIHSNNVEFLSLTKFDHTKLYLRCCHSSFSILSKTNNESIGD